jgi:predicted nucleic-acid-binding Zn-ribbon protein
MGLSKGLKAMDCPKCGKKDLLGDECPFCGVFVSKFLAIQERKKAEEEKKRVEAEENKQREDKKRAEAEEKERRAEAEEEKKRSEVICGKCGTTNFYNENHQCTKCGDWLYQYRSSNKENSLESNKMEAEYNASSIRCPKCNSIQINAQKQGFGLGKAAAGVMLLPVAAPLGLLAGFVRSRKIYLTCLKCGHKFKPG